MIIRESNQFKGTILRGYNDKVESIRLQMQKASDSWQQNNKQKDEKQHASLKPENIKETMIKMNRLKNENR